ncbi:unnamed protein product [Cyclocybe aegerita]|uniref:Uncharacterized protein n=1 Tax=Cyclocybe aegerita TaxID=1973307 RepID=A0A8S0VTT1_CYCAE|nr:unnamed protein product [Cyclocybe aegerita]
MSSVLVQTLLKSSEIEYAWAAGVDGRDLHTRDMDCLAPPAVGASEAVRISSLDSTTRGFVTPKCPKMQSKIYIGWFLIVVQCQTNQPLAPQTVFLDLSTERKAQELGGVVQPRSQLAN